MAGLATHTDVSSRDGAADGLMRHADEGGGFVDLEGEPRRVCGGIDEVTWGGFHERKKTPTCSWEQKSPLDYLFTTLSKERSEKIKSFPKSASTRRQASLKVDGSSY